MKHKIDIQRACEGIAETAARNAKLSGTESSLLAGTIFVDSRRPKKPRKMLQGSGPPSICWHCLKQLQRAPGQGLGLFYFLLVREDGVEHRVHGDCFIPATQGGKP